MKKNATILIIVMCGLVGTTALCQDAAVAALTPTPTSTPTPSATVAKPITVAGKMGPYLALTQLAMAAIDRKDIPQALLLGRILEATWDRGEQDLKKTDPRTWYGIDGSIDSFINPLGHYRPAKTDLAKIQKKGSILLQELSAAN